MPVNILLTNDDGIHAPGLAALYNALQGEHTVWVVAPEHEMSAVGHAISLNTPLRVKKVHTNGAFFGWAVNGTPADCVKIAVTELLPQAPDVVLSGINLGANTGINVLYSGTVSAATEAAILGYRATALSLNTYRQADFTPAARFARLFLPTLLELNLPPGVCLNINIPALPLERIKGLRTVRQDTRRLVEHFERRVDPRENLYYWLAGIEVEREMEEGTDFEAVNNDYIALTPIHHDLTHYQSLTALQEIIRPELQLSPPAEATT